MRETSSRGPWQLNRSLSYSGRHRELLPNSPDTSSGRYPRQGLLYPVETYLVINDVAGIPQGVYHYNVEEHCLEQVREGDYRVTVARAALDQKIAYEANLVFVWTAVLERCKWKYKQRAFRYIYLDAGHIAQTVALAAVALDLGSCQIAALYDEEVNDLLGVDGTEETAIYLTVVGNPNT